MKTEFELGQPGFDLVACPCEKGNNIETHHQAYSM